jgi:hypothetical protein
MSRSAIRRDIIHIDTRSAARLEKLRVHIAAALA